MTLQNPPAEIFNCKDYFFAYDREEGNRVHNARTIGEVDDTRKFKMIKKGKKKKKSKKNYMQDYTKIAHVLQPPGGIYFQKNLYCMYRVFVGFWFKENISVVTLYFGDIKRTLI